MLRTLGLKISIPFKARILAIVNMLKSKASKMKIVQFANSVDPDEAAHKQFSCLKFCSDKMLFMYNAMLLNYAFVYTLNTASLTILTWKPYKGHRQTVQTQIRCHMMWHLIKFYIVC